MGLLIKAFIMGVVEGLTEFLPVSSTGHMIIVGDFIDFKGESFHTMFEIVIQLGAILAVIFYYRDKIIDSLRHLRPGERGFELWFKIFIAFLPSAVIGLLLDDLIEEYLFSSFTVAIALIGGGFLMIFAENLFGRWGMDDMDKTDIRQALTIGVGQ
ncbi:MAG TPA: undecaprenyl-diphosphate phosphatase, partial [Tepidanaerobacteraceae bacterium]|nr:undecaprenyl-diphosphate phosphatase [Tepidanaerobacteraceae bacterium]